MRELLTNILLDTAEDCDLFRDFCAEVATGHKAKVALAQERDARRAKQREELDMVFNRDLGERIACVDSVTYWEMERLYGRDCWTDEGFIKDMVRDNPAMRINDKSRHTRIIRP